MLPGEHLHLNPESPGKHWATLPFPFGFLALKDLSLEVDVSVVVLDFCQKSTRRSGERRKRGSPSLLMGGEVPVRGVRCGISDII